MFLNSTEKITFTLIFIVLTVVIVPYFFLKLEQYFLTKQVHLLVILCLFKFSVINITLTK